MNICDSAYSFLLITTRSCPVWLGGMTWCNAHNNSIEHGHVALLSLLEQLTFQKDEVESNQTRVCWLWTASYNYSLRS